jgi:hypothetical protein
MTDPYTPPKLPADGPPQLHGRSGRPCPACGSRDTGEGVLGKRQAHPLNLLLFGWLYLIPLAFSRHTDTCRSCGEAFSYKTLSSKIALVILILIIILGSIAIF